MSKLKIVKASEVGDRPRWWCSSQADAEQQMPGVGLHLLHLGDIRATLLDTWVALVADDSPDPAPSQPARDPREEAVWVAVFCASTPTAEQGGGWEGHAANIADAALVEWRKRFA